MRNRTPFIHRFAMTANSSTSSPFQNHFAKWQRVIFCFVILAILLLRLFVTSDEEVLTLQGGDSINYVVQTNHYLDDNPMSRIPKQTPGLAMFAGSLKQIGIPYRLGLDLFLIGVAILCGWSMSKLTNSKLVGLLTFTLVALNPWSIVKGIVFLSEPLAGVLMLFMIMSAIPYFVLPSRRWSLFGTILTSVVSALYVLTRSEMPLLLVFWGLVILIVGGFHWRMLRRKGDWKSKAKLAYLMLPLIVAFGAKKTVEQLNQRAYGVKAIAATEAPGFKSLMNTLYTVVPKKEIRFSPVTLQSLRAACDASPTLNQHRKLLMDKSAPAFEFAKNNHGYEGQFGAWLNWHLIRAFGGMNATTDANMAKAAEEIKAAQETGELGKRFAFFPVDPMWEAWLPEFPDEFRKRLTRSVFPTTDDQKDKFGFRYTHDPVIADMYDEALNRRAGKLDGFRLYAEAKKTKFQWARLMTAEGEVLQVAHVDQYADQYRFEFEILEHDREKRPAEIYLFGGRGKDRQSCTYEIGGAATSRRVKFEFGDEKEPWKLSFSRPKPGDQPQKTTREFLLSNYYFGWCSCLVVGFFMGCWTRIPKQRRRRLTWFLVTVTLFLFARAAFYSLIEVWLDWGGFRYIEPSVLMTIFGSTALAFVVGSALTARFRR